jgi:hypothetical protein
MDDWAAGFPGLFRPRREHADVVLLAAAMGILTG